MAVTNRYSNKDLAVFEARIQEKLQRARKDLEFIQEQIQNTETNKREGDRMDDTSNSSDLDLLYMMGNRHRQHIRDLENALIRIHNKSYGICIISGELIDKRRLLAVPTTTKSLAAKTQPISEAKKNTPRKTVINKSKSYKIESKIISKKNNSTPVVLENEEDSEELFNFNLNLLDEELSNNELFNNEDF